MKKALHGPERKTFRNKYLAVLVMALSFCLGAFAQTDSTKYSKINGYGFIYKRMGTDSIQLIPLSTSPHVPYRHGAIRYNPTDSTLEYWTATQWIKAATGGAVAVDTFYAANDSTLILESGGNVFGAVVGTSRLDSLHIYTAANPDPDTLYSYKNGDSTLVGLLQKGGTDNANIGSGFRILVPATQELKTLHSDITGTWDSTSNADGLTYKVDTLTMSTRAWRQKGDDSVAAVLRQVVIDTANSLLASMSDSVVFAVSNMLIPARIEFVHAGSDTTMYQNDTLIGKQLVDVSIEGYKLGFTARASSVYMEFDSVTGTITLTNGAFVADDLILIIYRTPPIFLLDGSGNPVRDGSGNFIILN